MTTDHPSSMISPQQKYLTTEQVAKLTGISPNTLNKWRTTWPNGAKLGPRYLKPADTQLIRYSITDIEAWMEGQKTKNQQPRTCGQ